ncbi:hypothetical protein PENSOL_c023G01260 [Penicillium solitum]|uniref:Protein kinase domain-containing protein n=1 Tax=Penicillium solitum TaxID=60172 RepID=A0A1V6R093_9EURO|nr:uncharacterized protein PENSOL_c023G01260 [Penicillium solitum]OQD94855.1 hypothetical protein PENSOL_c023G01260 [Penicillium solitum]
MSGVELGLAILGTLDICLRYGNIVVGKYKAFHDAENEIGERKLAIEATWAKISQQLAFLKRIWRSLSKDHQDYQDLHSRIILVLQRKLEAAALQISRLEKHATRSGSGLPSKRKAAKYALWVKESLEEAIQDLQAWQKDFDTTWFLVVLVAGRTIDTELTECPGTEKLVVARNVRDSLRGQPQQATSVFLSESKLKSATRSDILYSTSQVIEIADSGTFILDSADCSFREDASTFVKHVRNLAVRLQQVDANAFHLLKCHGVVRTKDPDTRQILSFDFIFNMPKECSRPQSLRGLLLSQVECSLGDKISLAKQLAMSINYVHVLDFVHKNVRPETVLVFQGNRQLSQLGPLFLLGFKAFRTADSKTLRVGSSAWEEDIYQHPDRQGSNPNADYIMQHDIYSLGVCLLEIGLWESFVSSENRTHLSVENGLLKDQYTKLAKEKLPIRMGEKYRQVVVNCLSCIDTTNKDFGDESEFEDNDGILIGVKYIEKILLQLSEITV